MLSEATIRAKSITDLSDEFDQARIELEATQHERDEAIWTLDGKVDRAERNVDDARRALHRKLGIDT